MRNRILSQRYAKALFELDPQGLFDGEIRALSESFKGSPVLLQVMGDPMVAGTVKLQALRRAMKDAPDSMLRFLSLLDAKRRLGYLPDILQEYLSLRARRNGQISGQVISSVALAPEQIARLEQQISSQLKLHCSLESSVDPTLIGGFTIQIEDTVYDCSVKSQLEGLRNRFLNLAG